MKREGCSASARPEYMFIACTITSSHSSTENMNTYKHYVNTCDVYVIIHHRQPWTTQITPQLRLTPDRNSAKVASVACLRVSKGTTATVVHSGIGARRSVASVTILPSYSDEIVRRV